MTEAIKPCPFCQASPEVGFAKPGRMNAYVRCYCEVGPSVYGRISADEAIAAWNTRAPDPAAQELIEAARRMTACSPAEYMAAREALATALNKLEKADD